MGRIYRKKLQSVQPKSDQIYNLQKTWPQPPEIQISCCFFLYLYLYLYIRLIIISGTIKCLIQCVKVLFTDSHGTSPLKTGRTWLKEIPFFTSFIQLSLLVEIWSSGIQKFTLKKRTVSSLLILGWTQSFYQGGGVSK